MENVGHIYIYGEIGDSLFGEKPVRLLDIIQAVKSQPDALSYNVYINSPGGLVEEGFAIYNYLIGLGKPIKTVVKGFCGSIATVIFMAGNEREMENGSEFFIHNPWVEAAGDASQLREVADDIEEAEKDLISFYSKHTGLGKEALSPLMKRETTLTAEEAVSLGFATKIVQPLKAVAILKTKQKEEMKEKKTNALIAGLKRFFAAFEGGQPVAASTLTLKDGSTVYLEGELAVGSMVLTAEGGEAVEATSLELEDGTMLTLEGGVIVEVAAAAGEPTPNEEMEALKAALAEKETEIANLIETLNTKEAEGKAYQEKVDAELMALKKQIVSKYEPKASVKTFKKETDKDEPVNRITAAREKSKDYKPNKTK